MSVETFEVESVPKSVTLRGHCAVGCPFRDNEKDHYAVTLVYSPRRKKVIKLDSFLKLLDSYKDVDISGEELSAAIHKKVNSVILSQEVHVRVAEDSENPRVEAITE